MQDPVKLHVIFDTNIWFSQLGLTTQRAAAVRFFLYKNNARIAVPEVVRLEVKQKLVERLKSAKSQIQSIHRQLLSVFGSLTEVSLPSDEDIEARVESLLTGMDAPHVPVPFSLSAARSSFLKVINKTPPSSGKEQFKDGVIWANCLELLEKSDVYLVTDDSAFYEKNCGNSGTIVASTLREELGMFSNTLKLFRSIDQLLGEIRTNVEIDKDTVRRAAVNAEAAGIAEILRSTGYELDGDPDIEIKPFLTEVATQINFTFNLSESCLDATPQGRDVAQLELSGDGFFDTMTNTIDRLRILRVRFRYTDSDGEVRNKGTVGVAASIQFGARRVEHTVRFSVGFQGDAD